MADEKKGTKLATAYVQIMPSMGGIGSAIKQEFGAQGTSAGNSFTQSFLKILSGGAIAAGVKKVLNSVISAGSSFEAKMSEVTAISGALGDEIEALTKKAKEMGAKTKFSATESAQAFKYMAMAGWETEDMLSGIEGVMNLAAASGEELGTVSDIVTDALTAMGYAAKDSARFADVLAAAATNSNTNVGLMGYTFKYAAPLAGAMGYSMEDLAVAIGTMANAGIKGEMAGTQLRAILSNMISPTKTVSAAMDALGISMTGENGEAKSLGAVLQELRRKFSGLSETEKSQMAASIAGKEAMSGLLAIVGASDEDFAKLQGAIDGASGAAQEMSDIMINNLSGDMKLLESNAESLYLQIYGKLSPALRNAAQKASGWIQQIVNSGVVDRVANGFNTVRDTAKTVFDYFSDQLSWIGDYLTIDFGTAKDFVVGHLDEIKQAAKDSIEFVKGVFEDVNGKVKDFVDWLREGSGGAETLKGVVVGLAAAFAAYKAVVFATETATKAVAAAQAILNAVMSANPIGLVIAAVTALVAAFIYLWNNCEGFRNFFIEMWDKISSVATNAWNGIKNVFSNVGAWFRDKWQEAYSAVTGVFSKIGSFFSGVWNSIKNTFSNLGTAIGNAISNAVKSGINGVITLIENRINSAIKIINGAIKLINLIPGVSISTIGLLKMPRLEWGGILEKGQVGFLEGNGAEAVVPLSQNQKWIAAVARDMDNALGGASTERLEQKLDRVIDAVDRLANAGWYLDGNALVGGIAGRMDGAIGNQTALSRRGLA